MNRILKIMFLFIEIGMGFLILTGGIKAGCIIKSIFSISCPACGFTRAFREILSLNFIEAMRYNLLSIPVFILLVVLNSYLIYDIIKNKSKIETFLNKLSKFTIPILVVLVLNMIINNIRGI